MEDNGKFELDVWKCLERLRQYVSKIREEKKHFDEVRLKLFTERNKIRLNSQGDMSDVLRSADDLIKRIEGNQL